MKSWLKREVIHSEGAPKAIGPYSQAISENAKVGVREFQRLVFLSGQIPLDPATGALVEGDIRAQTERVMENLAAVLKAAELDFARVVKTTIYLVDLADFAAVNEVYGKRFSADPPARATVQVAALPKGARVEIDAIAVG